MFASRCWSLSKLDVLGVFQVFLEYFGVSEEEA